VSLDNQGKKQSDGSRLHRLSRRERFVVAGGIVFVACFLFYQVVVDPFLIRKQRLQRSLQQKADNVLEMKLLQKQYEQISVNEKDIIDQLQRRSSDFSLFTFVEEQIDEVRMKDRVTSMNPGVSEWRDGIRQTHIEVKIEAIVLAQLVDFLVAIESFDKVVFVDRIVVQNNSREDGLLDVMISVLTFEDEPAS